MFFVFSSTSVVSPPITPATQTASFPSVITISSCVSLRSIESKVVSVSFSLAILTTIVFPNASASKAWRGWPISNKTKFVISTTLLIGRTPQAINLAFSHCGEGLISTLAIYLAKYL